MDAVKTAEEKAMLSQIEQAQPEKAFFDSDKQGIIDKLPALLVGGDTLIVPSKSFMTIKDTDDFKMIMKDLAAIFDFLTPCSFCLKNRLKRLKSSLF